MNEPLTVIVLLAGIGFIAGIGITAIGPGGVLATVGLFLFTGLPPATVAGTALVTHIATGSLGTFAYVRSGQLHEANTRRIALVLAASAVIGTPIGVAVNLVIPAGLFGIVLALFAAFVAALVWRRQRGAGSGAGSEEQHHPRHAMALLIGWKIAHQVPARQLKRAMIAVLLAAAPFLALHG